MLILENVMSPQIGINIIEAQKLVGVNIDPFVVVKIGDEKRRTATQKSTNCPFYNEVCNVGTRVYDFASQSFLPCANDHTDTAGSSLLFTSEDLPSLLITPAKL